MVAKSEYNKVSHANKKSPAERQIQRLTGYLLPAAGVEPARNDDVMRSNAELCQIPCQNG